MPEAGGGVDGDGGELALELGRVDVAEFIGASCAVLEVRGEDGAAEERADVGEEGVLLCGADGVQGRKGETYEAVGRGIGGEGAGDLSRKADSLGRHGRTANVHRVGSDGAQGEGAVAVADVECGSGQGGGGAGFGGVVDCVARLRRRWEVGVKDPPGEMECEQVWGVRGRRKILHVRGASVEVHD